MKDVLIKVSEETRHALKLLAVKNKMTLKGYLDYISKKENRCKS
jgi:hypothetical protein